MSLSKKEERLITKEAKKVKDGDLYDALHRVGDDPVKSEIEDCLKDILDDKTFKRVVAIFNIATKW